MACAVALVGCSSSDAGAADRADPTTSVAPTAQVEIGEPQVTDPGAEPREELRIAFTEGDTARIALTIDHAVDQEVDGRQQRVDVPPITQTVEYRVGAVEADGSAALTIEVVGIAAATEGTSLDVEASLRLHAEIAPLVGVTGTASVSPRGTASDLEMDTPEAMSETQARLIDSMASSVETMGPGLPTDAVGIGATWKVETIRTAAGVTSTTTSTFTLEGIAEGELTYSAEVSTTSERQPIDLAGLDGSTSATLVSSTITGTANGTQSLLGPWFTSRSRSAGTQVIELNRDGHLTTVTQKLAIASAVRNATP